MTRHVPDDGGAPGPAPDAARNPFKITAGQFRGYYNVTDRATGEDLGTIRKKTTRYNLARAYTATEWIAQVWCDVDNGTALSPIGGHRTRGDAAEAIWDHHRAPAAT